MEQKGNGMLKQISIKMLGRNCGDMNITNSCGTMTWKEIGI